MTSIARSAVYSREYQRRRAAGIPTKGLARELAENGAPTEESRLDASLRRRCEILIARNLRTSQIMFELDLSYKDVQIVRGGMATR